MCIFQRSPEADKVPASVLEVSGITTSSSGVAVNNFPDAGSASTLTEAKVSSGSTAAAAAASTTLVSTTRKVSSSSNSAKPGKAMRSRKVTRAPQPPTETTPTTSSRSKKLMSPSRSANAGAARPCQTHSFHTDAAEVQQMETVLLKLLDDFNSGKLRAFGQGCSMEQMSAIRDQQESLAKLHFEIGARQDPSAPLSEEGLHTASENMDKLMGRLEKLSVAIGQLNPSASSPPVSAAMSFSPSAGEGLKLNIDGQQKVDR